MEMKNYHFKDSRPVFMWMYIILLLNVVHSIINVAKGTFTISNILFFVVVYSAIALTTYAKTTTKVYIDEQKIELGKVHYYRGITEINAENDIVIKSDGWVDRIGVYELEKNYDEYKELLEHILQRVDEKVAMKTGGAQKLLETVKSNKETRFAKEKLANGRIKLGGILKLFNVFAYYVVVFGAIALFALIMAFITGESIDFTKINFPNDVIFMFFINLLTVILMRKRMNNVKYALALTSVVTIITGIISFVKSIINFTNGIDFTYDVIGVVIRITIAVLTIKAYIYYIDNFDRPKQTLVN